METWQIRVAHSMGRKNGTHYAARAYAVRNGIRCTYTIAIEDTPQDAERGAVEYVKAQFERDGLDAPEHVTSAGRLPRALLDNFSF
jgi:hypothetical protein